MEGTHHGSYDTFLEDGGIIVFQGCIWMGPVFHKHGRHRLHDVASTENVIAKQAGINCKLPF